MESKLPSPPSGDLPPISRADLKALFDYLARPNPPPCSHTLKETEAFLLAHNLQEKPLNGFKGIAGTATVRSFTMWTRNGVNTQVESRWTTRDRGRFEWDESSCQPLS
jgi:hypothetical protein